MEHFLVKPTLWIFLVQALLLTSVFPLSYLGYRSVRIPQKQERVKLSLAKLGITNEVEALRSRTTKYYFRDYVWPLFMISSIVFVGFGSAHPYTVDLGFMSGFIEEMIDIFGLDDVFPRALLTARMFIWAWFGAYTYSFHLTFRRFLTYDLTPSVYVFASNRFILAYSVAIIVGIVMATLSKEAGVTSDVNMAMVFVTVFFIGFFPEQGVNWITTTAQKLLKQQQGIVKEKQLSKIEGLSIWHQGRLRQEQIENIQNLATVDVAALVISTPFAVTQIIDWIDQAILLRHTSDVQFEALEKIGVICASDFLTTSDNGRDLSELAEATGLNKNELKVLNKTLKSALNIKLVTRFRWQSSIDTAQVERSATLQVSNTQSTTTEISQKQETKTAKKKEQNLSETL